MRMAVSLRTSRLCQKTGFGWMLATLYVCAACGSDDPSASGSGGASGSPLPGRAGSGVAGRQVGDLAGHTASAGRTGSAGTTAGRTGVAGTTAGRTGPAGVTAGRTAAGAPSAAGTEAVGSASFAEVYTIISARCAGSTCHVGIAGAGGGNLAMNDRASAYKNLVGVNAAICRGEKRVVAGNPAKSELVHTLARTKLGTCSTPQMPEALPKLAQAEIDKVIAWVSAGAPNN